MADIYGSHFEYAGRSSRRCGLIIVNADSDRFTRLSGSITGQTIFNRVSKKRYIIGNDYSDFPVSYEVDIVTDNECCLPPHERRDIEKWLFNRHGYRQFYLDIEDDYLGETCELVDGLQKRLYMNCRFLNPERLEFNGGVVGYHATLEADSGLWWQDTIVKRFEVNLPSGGSSYNNIKIDVDTDLDDYTYPKVTFVMGDTGGNVWFYNYTDDSSRVTKFTNLSAYQTVIIRGDTNYVSSYANMATRNFPRLLDGENRIDIYNSNIASIEFEFNNRRML